MTRRLLVSYLTVTVIVLLLLEVPLALFFSQREEERFIADAERDAVVLASFYEDSLQNGGGLDSTFADEFSARTGARVVVTDIAGISVLDTQLPIDRDFSTRPEVETALTGHRSGGVRHSETLSSDLLFVAVPVASGGRIYGTLRLTVDAGEVTERIYQFWFGLAGVAVVVLLAIGGIGWGIARSVSRPLRELQASSLRFADGDLAAAQEPKDAPPEIRELAGTMNTMAARLDELMVAQRAFVGDASHQLRTPLTALRLRLENLESGLEGEAAVETVAAIEETSRLSELVDDLLRLARSERPTEPAEFDLASIAQDRVETWSALGDQDGVGLALDGSSVPLTIMASPGSVEQILDNLLDNALKVSPTGSTITVGVRSTPTTGVLTVSDEGPGLDDMSKTRALERFWRGDQTTPGTGLGLAIVQALARASGGDIRLTDSPSGGLSVEVSLPRSLA